MADLKWQIQWTKNIATYAFLELDFPLISESGYMSEITEHPVGLALFAGFENKIDLSLKLIRSNLTFLNFSAAYRF